MSYDLYVHTRADREISTSLFTKTLEEFGWQIRLINDDNIIITDLREASVIMAWDRTCEPASVFDQRYRSGSKVDFYTVVDEDIDFIGACALYIDDYSFDEWEENEFESDLGKEKYMRFVTSLDGKTIRTYNFHTSASSHPFRFILQSDLAEICAWTTGGIVYNPQAGESCFVEKLSPSNLGPLERARKSMEYYLTKLSPLGRARKSIAEFLSGLRRIITR